MALLGAGGQAARVGGPIRAAVFDIGATLVTGPSVAPNKVIAALMDGVTAAEVASVIMTRCFAGPEEVCAALESRFGPLPPAAARGVRELWNLQSDAAREIEGASAAVLALRRRGLKIGLLSDIWNPYYASVEKAIPAVVECADAVILSFRTGARKPSPDNFLRMISQLGIGPREAVMIGDTYAHDVLPALQVGMEAVWVLARPERERADLVEIFNGTKPAPTAAVARIADVPDLWIWSARGERKAAPSPPGEGEETSPRSSPAGRGS